MTYEQPESSDELRQIYTDEALVSIESHGQTHSGTLAQADTELLFFCGHLRVMKAERHDAYMAELATGLQATGVLQQIHSYLLEKREAPLS